MKQVIALFLSIIFVPFNFTAQHRAKKEKPIEIQLVFKPGKTNMTVLHKNKLSQLVSYLEQDKEVFIYPLSTYRVKNTRSSATYQYNRAGVQKIWFDPKSNEQAEAIIAYLENMGLNDFEVERNFSYHLKGPTIRIKFENLEIEEKTTEPKEEPAPKNQIPLKDYFPEKESQFFVIDPKKDTLIEGKEGTKLFFACGTMMSKNLVQIELKEYYQSSDFLKAGLQTVSNGKSLFTGGTIYLDAREKDNPSKQVKINPSRGINAEFTNGKDDPEMKVFYKDERSAETNWLLDKVQRTWRYTRNYMLNENETYKTFVFNSPNEYQEFVTSGEAEKVEEDWITVLRAIAQEEWNAKMKAEMERQEKARQQARERDEIVSRLTLNKLGFINCDRFVDEEMERYDILVDNTVGATYYAVFEGDKKGIIKGRGSQTVSFGNLPKNLPVTIIGVSITEGEKLIYKKNLSSIKQDLGGINFTKASEQELESLLSSVN